jgi:hypothetical protein
VGVTVLGAVTLLLATVVVAPLLVPAAIYLSFRPTGDLRALHRAVARATDGELEREIELALRPTVFALVRAGAVWADLPPEARSALRVVRGAEIGLYQVTSARRSPGPATLLAEIDRAMVQRGWDRVVGVVGGRGVVAVFAPQSIPSPGDLRLAVLVYDGAQLVVASVRGDPEALVELALNQAPGRPYSMGKHRFALHQ